MKTTTTPRAAAAKLTVQCQECGKRWRVSAATRVDLQCSKCNSADVEPAVDGRVPEPLAAAARNVTAKEREVLLAFTLQDHLDGAHPVGSQVWVNCIVDKTTTVKGKALSAVMGSLVRKGLVTTDGETCILRQAGYDVVFPPAYFLDGEPIDLGEFFQANDEESLGYDERLSVSKLGDGEVFLLGGGAAPLRVVSRGTPVRPEDLPRVGTVRVIYPVKGEIVIHAPANWPPIAPQPETSKAIAASEIFAVPAPETCWIARALCKGRGFWAKGATEVEAIAALRAVTTAAHGKARVGPIDAAEFPAGSTVGPDGDVVLPESFEVPALAAEDEVQVAPEEVKEIDEALRRGREAARSAAGSIADLLGAPKSTIAVRLSPREQCLVRRLYNHEALPNALPVQVERRSDREFDLGVSGILPPWPGDPSDGVRFSAWLPLAALASLDWTSLRIAGATDYPEMAAAGDWSGVRDTDRDRLWAILAAELPILVGEVPAPRKSPKSAPRRERAEAAARSATFILGLPSAHVARWIGARGWTFAECQSVFAAFGVFMGERSLYHRFLEGRNAGKRAAVGKNDPMASPSPEQVAAIEAKRPGSSRPLPPAAAISAAAAGA